MLKYPKMLAEGFSGSMADDPIFSHSEVRQAYYQDACVKHTRKTSYVLVQKLLIKYEDGPKDISYMRGIRAYQAGLGPNTSPYSKEHDWNNWFDYRMAWNEARKKAGEFRSSDFMYFHEEERIACGKCYHRHPLTDKMICPKCKLDYSKLFPKGFFAERHISVHSGEMKNPWITGKGLL